MVCIRLENGIVMLIIYNIVYDLMSGCIDLVNLDFRCCELLSCWYLTLLNKKLYVIFDSVRY